MNSIGTGGHEISRDETNMGLSNFMTYYVNQQDENPYSEIQCSQRNQTCAVPTPPTCSSDGGCSEMPSLRLKKNHIHGKCASESNYDHIEWKKRIPHHDNEYSTHRTLHVEQYHMTDEQRKQPPLSFHQHKQPSFMSLPRRFYSTTLNDTDMTSRPSFRTLSEPYLHQIKAHTLKTAVGDPSHHYMYRKKCLKPDISVEVRPYSLVNSLSSNH